VDTFAPAASIDPRLAPTSLGMGGGANEAGTALLGRVFATRDCVAINPTRLGPWMR
jgi:hypothetical protein